MASGGNKTEKPTPQKLKQAREKGQFLVSRGGVSAFQFVVAIVLLPDLVSGWQTALRQSMPELLRRANAGEISGSEWPSILRHMLLQNMQPLAQFCGTLLITTLAAHLAISRFGFSLQKLMPDFGRLSPLAKLKQLPGQNLKSVIEAALLMVALTTVINSLLEEHGEALLRLPLESLPSATAQVAGSIQSLLWKAAALFVVFGAADFIREQRKYMSGLRMSREDIKEEHKRAEGDPQLKGRIRRLRRDLLRKRMMQDVATATAVVVNPTHFAVAIRYDIESMPSPLVVAKGRNWMALRIRQIAVQNQVPVIENPPLARALFDAVEVGRAISPEFYKAIAEILAYVYRILGRRLPS